MAQTFGIVDVFVSGKPPEHGLPQQPDQRMAAVLAGAGVSELPPAIALRPRASSSSR